MLHNVYGFGAERILNLNTTRKFISMVSVVLQKSYCAY